MAESDAGVPPGAAEADIEVDADGTDGTDDTEGEDEAGEDGEDGA